MNIVLHEPEIPFNTGAIGRTVVAAGSELHLIRPYGFVLSDKYIKRAGMDYWGRLKLSEYLDYEDFLEKNQLTPGMKTGRRLWFATTKAEKTYSEAEYGTDDFIMFGKESAGIPEEILRDYPEMCIRIPMTEGERSLNLSNSVAVILYEALRQNGFMGLERKGRLHRLEWKR